MTRPKSPEQQRTEQRATDRALRTLVAFLVIIVAVACVLAYTAIHRQALATCYQLVSVESAADREKQLAGETRGAEHDAHVKSLTGLRLYAGGLRRIVPGCPVPR